MLKLSVFQNPVFRLSALGWGVTFLGSFIHCGLFHSAIQGHAYDPFAGVCWVLREWGPLALITPLIFMALEWAETNTIPLTTRLLALASLIMTLALLRSGLGVLQDGVGWIEGLIYILPKYMTAALLVLCGWKLVLQPRSDKSPSAEPPETPPTHTILCEQGSRKISIRLDEVHALHAAGNYVEVRTHQACHLLRSSLGDLEARLPDQEFLRVHRSHLIRRSQLQHVRPNRNGNALAILKSGIEIPVSKSAYQSLRRAGQI